MMLVVVVVCGDTLMYSRAGTRNKFRVTGLSWALEGEDSGSLCKHAFTSKYGLLLELLLLPLAVLLDWHHAPAGV